MGELEIVKKENNDLLEQNVRWGYVTGYLQNVIYKLQEEKKHIKPVVEESFLEHVTKMVDKNNKELIDYMQKLVPDKECFKKK